VSVDLDAVELPPHVEVALYRIVQEAFQNVVKHAGATRVDLRLGRDDEGVRLVVADDGRGFDEHLPGATGNRHSYGLLGIQERAELIGARVTVESGPDRGTTVEVLLPQS
jgi:signal transduction histidine kinase